MTGILKATIIVITPILTVVNSNLLKGIAVVFWRGLIICLILAFILLKNDTPK